MVIGGTQQSVRVLPQLAWGLFAADRLSLWASVARAVYGVYKANFFLEQDASRINGKILDQVSDFDKLFARQWLFPPST